MIELQTTRREPAPPQSQDEKERQSVPAASPDSGSVECPMSDAVARPDRDEPTAAPSEIRRSKASRLLFGA